MLRGKMAAFADCAIHNMTHSKTAISEAEGRENENNSPFEMINQYQKKQQSPSHGTSNLINVANKMTTGT